MAKSESKYGHIKISLGDRKIFETKGEERKIYKDLKEFIYHKG